MSKLSLFGRYTACKSAGLILIADHVQKITEALRNPALVQKIIKSDSTSEADWCDRLTRLQNDINTALLCDPGNSPSADITRRETGLLGLCKHASVLCDLTILSLALTSSYHCLCSPLL